MLRSKPWLRITILPCLLALLLPLITHAQPINEGIRPDERPNLAAGQWKVTPAHPKLGESLSISLEVQNQSEDSLDDIEIDLYIDAQKHRTKRVSITAESSATVTWAWSAETAGLHTVTAVINPDNKLVEREILDNTTTADVLVQTATSPVNSLTVNSIEQLDEGDLPSRIRVEVENHGNNIAEAPLEILVDGESVSSLVTGPVEPGATTSIELPFGTLKPISRLEARIISDSVRQERFQGPRSLLLDARPTSDLQAGGLSVQTVKPESDRPRQITISFYVANVGREPVSRPFKTSMSPGGIGPDGLGVYQFLTESLAPTERIYMSRTLEAAPSEFDILVEVDSGSDISESNEQNNRLTSVFKNPSPQVGRWVSIGPRRITNSTTHGYAWKDAIGRLASIAISPDDPSVMYVGAKGSGIWKTTNGGSTWQPLTDAINPSVASLVIDPNDSNRVFWATANDGVFRSLDAGQSWQQISTTDLDALVHGGVLRINPDDPNTLYVTTRKGVNRSTDGGLTWQLSKSGGNATGLEMDTGNPLILHSAIVHKTDNAIAGIYLTQDGGTQWTKVTGCPGAALPTVTSDTKITLANSMGTLYAGFRSSDRFQLYRTTNISCSVGGRIERRWEKAWSTMTDHAPIWGNLWADPSDSRFLYLGGTYFWRSIDGGETFEITSGLGSPTSSAHVDHHGFSVNPLSPSTIYSLNDGGIYRSNSRGAKSSWTFVGDGISNVEFYDHASAPSASETVIGGTQDNGTIRYTGSTTWDMIRGGDGATVAFDPKDERTMYSMNQYANSIGLSDDGGVGNDWLGLGSGLPGGSQCFNLHFQHHPKKASTLLASCSTDSGAGQLAGGLWRLSSANLPGATWTSIFNDPSSSVTKSAVDASSDIYYAATNRGKLYAGLAGANWQSVFTHPAAMPVTDVEVDRDRPEDVYASFGGSNTRRVYRLTRSSSVPVVLQTTDITNDLPIGLRVRTLAVDRMQSYTVYVGTQQGVYRGQSLDQGASWRWRPYSNGLPITDVRKIEVHETTGVMRATTHGRGAFEVYTDFPIGSVLSIAGKATYLRVHDVGSGWGPENDFLDVEVVVRLDSEQNKAFGIQLRKGGNELAHRGIFEVLRKAFRQDSDLRLDYIRRGIRNGEIIRAIILH